MIDLEMLAEQIAQTSWYCAPDFDDNDEFNALSKEDKAKVIDLTNERVDNCTECGHIFYEGDLENDGNGDNLCPYCLENSYQEEEE